MPLFQQLNPPANTGLQKRVAEKITYILFHKCSIELLKYKKCIFPLEIVSDADFSDHDIGQCVHKQCRTGNAVYSSVIFQVSIQACTRIGEYQPGFFSL